ncbi:hypothetical protein Trydic_g8417 [Trypoxylus dichotomus]
MSRRKQLQTIQNTLRTHNTTTAQPQKISHDAPPKQKVSAARCYNCNEEEHIIKQYTKPRREQGSCFTCGEASHKYRDCPGHREQQNSAVNIVQPLIVNLYIENNLPGIRSKC